MIDTAIRLAARPRALAFQPPLPRTRGARTGRAAPCGGIVVLGIDGMRELADRHGEAAAKRARELVEETLRRTLVEDDGLVTWSEHEFLLLLSHADLERVADLGELLVMAVRLLAVNAADGARLPLTCSVGWSTFDWQPVEGSSWRLPIAAASAALAAARALGGDCCMSPANGA